MDPKAVFHAVSLTREKIAEFLNDITESTENELNVKPNDPRLTNELCQKLAEIIGTEMIESIDWDDEDLGEDLVETFLG